MNSLNKKPVRKINVINKWIIFLVILLFIAVLFIPTSAFKLFLGSFIFDRHFNSESACYSGWVDSNFTETFTSTQGFSFKYPSYLKFYSHPQINEDRYDHSMQIVEGQLEVRGRIPFMPYIFIDIETNKRQKPIALLSLSNSPTRIPCNLENQTSYNSWLGNSLGWTIYGVNVATYYPNNQEKNVFLQFSCNDDNHNERCNSILPQILSTLRFNK